MRVAHFRVRSQAKGKGTFSVPIEIVRSLGLETAPNTVSTESFHLVVSDVREAKELYAGKAKLSSGTEIVARKVISAIGSDRQIDCVISLDIPAQLKKSEIVGPLSFPEGKQVMVAHLRRERNAKLARDKKKEVLRKTGKLACQICAFDFDRTYGEVGRGFIECHHIQPLSEQVGIVDSALKDVILVCANCHRMLHRRRPWLSIRELNQLIPRLPSEPDRQSS